jgi:hypothetical protein
MTLDLGQLADLAASLTLAARKQLDAAGSITGPADDRRYYAQASAIVLLARTLHLLDEQAICVLSKAPEAARMLLRQIIELDITGRYLLAYPDQVDWAVDETYRQRRAQLAVSRMDPNDSLVVAFSQEHPIPKGHLRSNVEQMAAAVGSVDQYVSLYRQISRTVMHTLDSLEPYSSVPPSDTTRLEIHPRPVVSPAFLKGCASRAGWNKAGTSRDDYGALTPGITRRSRACPAIIGPGTYGTSSPPAPHPPRRPTRWAAIDGAAPTGSSLPEPIRVLVPEPRTADLTRRPG